MFFSSNILQLSIPTSRSMKFVLLKKLSLVLLAIIAFRLANSGEAQTTSRCNADSCDCTGLWISRTLTYFFYFNIPTSTNQFVRLTSNRPRQFARKIIQKWDYDGCFDIEDHKDMINVGYSSITFAHT